MFFFFKTSNRYAIENALFLLILISVSHSTFYRRICQGENIRIFCSNGKIFVLQAFYGEMSNCGKNEYLDTTTPPCGHYVTDIFKSATDCHNEEECYFDVNDSIYGGTSCTNNNLYVEWDCGVYLFKETALIIFYHTKMPLIVKKIMQLFLSHLH